MAVDKLVDSSQLDADLTSVANAIRTKGGTSASLAFPAGFVSAIEAIPSGGGGSILSGSVTPTTDTDGMTIDVGGSFTHFVVYATTNPGGNSIKVFRASICDFSASPTNIVSLSTNNSGTALAGAAQASGYEWFTKSGTTVACRTGTSGAVSPGYWAAGITYQWWAW